MPELLGTTQQTVRVMHKGSLLNLRRWAQVQDLKFYAIYRDYWQLRRFHNATDKRFLIEHRNDPYWLNRGVVGV
ncbi:MAG: hypothetical protein ACXABY_24745 [Candidatus Thorarchaeota archaeon]|jgi:hypothetical protein